MIIPTTQTFTCADDPDARMIVQVTDPGHVYIEGVDSDGEMYLMWMRDREQITMLRDMLTAWLSRP